MASKRRRYDPEAYQRQRDLEKRQDRRADRWLAKHGHRLNTPASKKRQQREQGPAKLPRQQRSSPPGKPQPQPSAASSEAEVVGKTKRCCRCRKRAMVWEGHVHLRDGTGLVIAGFCRRCDPSRGRGLEHAQGLPDCPGCYGLLVRGQGVQPVDAEPPQDEEE